MRKFKQFIDFEKEEKWLGEMALKGYHLKNRSFGYSFQHGEPEKARIRVDYRTFKRNEDFVEYCTLFEDSGWLHIAGGKSSGYQYFKKGKPDGDDDIFSDSVSRAGKYKRLSDMFISLACSFLPIFAVLVMTDAIDVGALMHPKELYFTPGLWNLSGAPFWRAFLFETPFALMRGIAWVFIPVTIILYFIFAIKAKKLYEMHKDTSF